MNDLRTEQEDTSANRLAATEIICEIKALREGEKTAIVKIARLYARKTRYDYEDLLQEAYSRALDGRRAWTRGVPAVLFFGGVIRSLAWEWKNEFVNEVVDVGDEGAQERGTAAKIDLMKIMALFDDDHVAQRIIEGMMEGAKGEELQEANGLSPTEYETKRKKIRRRIEKLAP
jgi:hypothetical protein